MKKGIKGEGGGLDYKTGKTWETEGKKYINNEWFALIER